MAPMQNQDYSYFFSLIEGVFTPFYTDSLPLMLNIPQSSYPPPLMSPKPNAENVIRATFERHPSLGTTAVSKSKLAVTAIRDPPMTKVDKAWKRKKGCGKIELGRVAQSNTGTSILTWEPTQCTLPPVLRLQFHPGVWEPKAGAAVAVDGTAGRSCRVCPVDDRTRQRPSASPQADWYLRNHPDLLKIRVVHIALIIMFMVWIHILSKKNYMVILIPWG